MDLRAFAIWLGTYDPHALGVLSGAGSYLFGDGPDEEMRWFPDVPNPAPDLAEALPKMREGWRDGYSWAAGVFRQIK